MSNQLVSIEKLDTMIRVRFNFDNALVKVMQINKGRFRKIGTDKYWEFPKQKYDIVYDEITKLGNDIKIKGEDEYESTIDVWKDKSVVGVYGHCKKCKEYTTLNREGKCIKCR